MPTTTQHAGHSEDWKEWKVHSCVTAVIHIPGENEVPITLRKYSRGIYTFQSQSKPYRTQIQPSYINVSPFLLSTGTLRNCASCTAEMETQIAASCVGDTTE